MIVKDKVDGIVYEVFDISYDKSGYPHFLIYKGNQWIRKSAKYFMPLIYTLDTAMNVEDSSITDNLDVKSSQELINLLRTKTVGIIPLSDGGTIAYNE